MVSVQNFRQHNKFQIGNGFGVDETMKLKARLTDWLMKHERKKMIKTSKSDNFMVIFTSYRQLYSDIATYNRQT
jgi:hypothetical protein